MFLMTFFTEMLNANTLEAFFPISCETEGITGSTERPWMSIHIFVLPMEQMGQNRTLISAELCYKDGLCKNHKDWFYGTHKKVGSKIIVESSREDNSRLEIDLENKEGVVILDNNGVGRTAREVITSSVGIKVQCQ